MEVFRCLRRTRSNPSPSMLPDGATFMIVFDCFHSCLRLAVQLRVTWRTYMPNSPTVEETCKLPARKLGSSIGLEPYRAALYESADWHIKSAANVADILLSKARQNIKSKARVITHLQVRLFKRSLTIGHLFR